MFKLELTLDEVNLILATLGKAPYETVAGLVAKIREQAQPQFDALQAAQAAEEESAAE